MQVPKGREQVCAALIETATTLFAQRGPAAVSVREIAQLTGVNHGLIHRHFGSKNGLLVAVLDQLADTIGATVGETTENEPLFPLLRAVLGATSQQGAWLRILAWSILDDADLGDMKNRFPMVDRMIAAAQREDIGPLDAQARVTFILSVSLGMALFGSSLKQATEQDEPQWIRTKSQIRSIVFKT